MCARFREPAPAVGRRGFTLFELIVSIALLGILAGVTALSVSSARTRSISSPILARIYAVRDSALRSGHRVSAWIADSAGGVAVTALPDGRVVTDWENGGTSTK